MQALADNGAAGWMIWNAAAQFTEDALGGPLEGENYALVTAADASGTPGSSPSSSP
jgi:hypothetical protein